MHTTTWHMLVNISEEDGSTRAEAVLRTDAGAEFRHVGRALCLPGDRDVPEIGDELAVSRALSGLAQYLLLLSMSDIEANRGVTDKSGSGEADAADAPHDLNRP